MYRSILFDLDGTLTNPREGIIGSVRYALVQEGYDAPPAEELLWVIGPPLRNSFGRLTGCSDAGANRLLDRYRERYSPVGLFENTVFPEIPAVLQALVAAGKSLYLATSKPAVYAKKILQHFQLASYFSGIHGAELDGTRDAKADVIAHVLATHALDVGDCVMIGDREHDIIGASTHQMQSIGVLYGFGSEDELRQAGASAIAPSPRDLLALLGMS